MWIIIGSYVAAMVAGLLLGVAFQLARDTKLLEKADVSCEDLVKATDTLVNTYRKENKRLIRENEKLKNQLNFYKLGGNAENEHVQSDTELLPLSAELSEA